MTNICTVREAVQRAKDDHIPISEYALRQMIKTGAVPVRLVGKKALLYYPTLVRHLQCVDGGDVCIKNEDTPNGIRKVR